MRATKTLTCALAAATLFTLSACGEGMLLGAPQGSNSGYSLRLNLIYGAWKASSFNSLSLNGVPAGLSFPLGGAYTDYSAADLIAMSDAGNPSPIRTHLTTANMFLLSYFCFDVSNIDLSQFKSVKLSAQIDGGAGPAPLAPTIGSFNAGIWDEGNSAFDPAIIYGDGFNMTSVDAVSSASTIPPSAFITTLSGDKCMMVAVLSTTASGAAPPPYSTLGIQHLIAYLLR